MTEVKNTIYNEDKELFFKKHDNDFTVDTTPMTEYGTYNKTYSFTDGAMWCECMSPVVEKTTVEVHGVMIPVTVKLQKIEYWSTDNGSSRFYYERW